MDKTFQVKILKRLVERIFLIFALEIVRYKNRKVRSLFVECEQKESS